jgi:hypothetical protein
MRGAYPDKVESYASQLEELAQWCDDALSQLPKQKRSRDGHWLPPARIWEALVRTHGTRRPMTLRLSSSPGSPFREICGICYEVMTGKPGADPERAIKNYIRAKRRSENAQRAEMGIATSRRQNGDSSSRKSRT